ncbi:MAG TPA: tol-pal system protein YbgF [Methylotenera sp.]|nr:tol-pal system protein YbgF [Methylotenera sp.]
MMKKLILASLLLAAQLFAVTGHAALFDDKEARKKILEVETTMQSQNQASQAAIADLKKSQQAIEQRLQAIEAIVKGQGLVDMQNQIEVLKQEVARLKGELEVAGHNIDATQQRQKDLYGDTDTRLRKLEGVATPTSSTQAPVVAEAAAAAATAAAPDKSSQEFQLLELANGLSRESKNKDAFNAYDKFLKDYPNSALAADAKYGLGYSQFALKNYKSAIATQQKVLDMHPDSPKVPDAMFNMANSQIQLGQVANAKKTLKDLVAKFPNSEVTPTAQKRLKALEAIR